MGQDIIGQEPITGVVPDGESQVLVGSTLEELELDDEEDETEDDDDVE